MGFNYWGWDLAWVSVFLRFEKQLELRYTFIEAFFARRGRCDSGIVSCPYILLLRILTYYLGPSLFSFLPPSTTLRRYQRLMMSTTVAELGGVYCSIVSFANTHRQEDVDKRAIIQSLIAIRLKLKRSLVLKTNVVYEVISAILP